MQHWELVNNGAITVASTAKELWENAANYFKWCDENPIVVKKTLTSGKEAGKRVMEESTRPYTIKGLCVHCGILEEYIRDIRATKSEESEYYKVVSTVMYIIYIQLQEHAITGHFNPIFTAKVLGMERDETPTQAVKVEIVGGVPELAKSENEILEKLELELSARELR